MTEQRCQEDIVLSNGVYMTYTGENPHGALRGRAWNYLIDRFQRDTRLPKPILFDKYQGLEVDSANGKEIPSGILFEDYPDALDYHWYYHEVDGLLVPTLRRFVDRVNTDLDTKTHPAERARVLKEKLGPGVGIVILSHLDRAADHFLQVGQEG